MLKERNGEKSDGLKGREQKWVKVLEGDKEGKKEGEQERGRKID